MNNSIQLAAYIIILLTGIIIALYPKIHGYKLNTESSRAVNQFYEEIYDAEFAPAESDGEQEEAELPEVTPMPYASLYADMEAYNEQLYLRGQDKLASSWAYQEAIFELSEYGLSDEVFGTVSVPSLDILLPLYIGASESNMAKGAAIMAQTSMPIGGKNTNCVIAGHCGFYGADYFRYLCDIQLGDEVIITTPWSADSYTVVETKIIQPDDIAEILIRPDRELLTLLTCHPYASGGKYRFLAFCERTNEYGN